jgi:hypothetical protein
MPWHKPRFRLVHLIVLVVVVALDFGLLPTSVSPGIAALTLATALLASVNGPISKMEWAVIVAIHALLILLLAPAAHHSHSRPRKPGPATTSAPPFR